jgi:uncharacterized protein YkwD
VGSGSRVPPSRRHRRVSATATALPLALALAVAPLVAVGLAADAAAARTSTETVVARDVLAKVNAERRARGLGTLADWGGGTAQREAEAMRAHGSAAHYGPNQPGFGTVAQDFTSAGAVLLWMRSDLHRSILMRADAGAAYVGVACAPDRRLFVSVQVFADPARPTPTVPASPVVTRSGSGLGCDASAAPAGGCSHSAARALRSGESGYWMVDASGRVYAFGAVRSSGDAPAGSRISGLAPTPRGRGYWLLDASGRVLPCGDATAYGGATMASGERAGAIAALPSGEGYWIFTDRGRVLARGAARHHGDMARTRLNGAVVAAAPTPDGRGYYLIGSDGGVFSFGTARFHGSMGATRLNSPVVGIAPDPDGVGYWLVAADGGIFAFRAPFRGSMGGRHLNRPVVGAIAFADGYLLVAADGGIFNFSSRPFAGSLGAHPPADPVVAVAAASSR